MLNLKEFWQVNRNGVDCLTSMPHNSEEKGFKATSKQIDVKVVR